MRTGRERGISIEELAFFHYVHYKSHMNLLVAKPSCPGGGGRQTIRVTKQPSPMKTLIPLDKYHLGCYTVGCN
jgi:hypothetical protein